MKKQLKETTVYEPNKLVKVTVSNTPVVNTKTGRTEYVETVTIKIDNGVQADKLAFLTDDEIAQFVANVDFDDPQTTLPL